MSMVQESHMRENHIGSILTCGASGVHLAYQNNNPGALSSYIDNLYPSRLTGKEDLRVRRTLTSVHRAFTEMLLEMPYDKITVTELSRRANINKKTFYRYYPTLDDLLEEIQLEYARPYVELTSGLRYPEDTDAIVREFLLYSSRQGPLYDAILSLGMYESILSRLMEEMSVERGLDARPKDWSDKEWSLYLAYVNESQIRFYSQWVSDGREVPVNRMVSLGVRLISNGAFLQRR